MATTSPSPAPSSSPSPTSEQTTSSTSNSPTTTSPTTSTNPPTSSSSSSSSSSQTSSSQTTATSSSQSQSSSSSSSSSSSESLSVTQVVTTSGDVAQTITSYITPTVTTSPTSQNASSSNSFFSNKGAVVGVFTVVGLVVVALAIALIVNAVKRHRAQKFDRDVAEAAAEAAASTRSPFEDYAYNQGANGGGGGGGGGTGYGYSDNSHGTYNLPPISPRDTYGMSEMSQYDPYAAGPVALAAAAVGRTRSRKESEPGTPGIAGVGAGTLAREPSKRAPYHAFAGPAPQPQDLQRGNGTVRSIRGTSQDVLEAAGLAGTGLSAGAYVTRRASDTTQNTHFSGSHRSQFGSMSGHNHPTTLQPGYPVDAFYPQRRDSRSDPFAGYPTTMAPLPQSLPNPHEVALPASPPPGQPSVDPHEEYTEPSSPALQSDEQRMSYQDDADYSQGNRVLRVANE